MNAISNIIRNLPADFASHKGLVSMTLHGSCDENKMETQSYIDLDVIFIYERSGLQRAIKTVSKYFESLCNKKYEQFEFLFSLKSGPMHPLRKNSCNLIDLNERKICFFMFPYLAMKIIKTKSQHPAPANYS